MNRLILLVDDDEDGRTMLCEMLRLHGFEAESVESAYACLARLASSEAAIVVTDIQMPVMSGVELCDALRRDYPNVRVIVISGIGDPAMAAIVMALGAITFLPKPVTLGDLETQLHNALASIPQNEGHDALAHKTS
jgi:FixJ family two-component response regulator